MVGLGEKKKKLTNLIGIKYIVKDFFFFLHSIIHLINMINFKLSKHLLSSKTCPIGHHIVDQ